MEGRRKAKIKTRYCCVLCHLFFFLLCCFLCVCVAVHHPFYHTSFYFFCMSVWGRIDLIYEGMRVEGREGKKRKRMCVSRTKKFF